MRILKNIHPGEVLKEEFWSRWEYPSIALLKRQTFRKQDWDRLSGVRGSITAETALKLGKFFGVPAEFWMNLRRFMTLKRLRKGTKRH